MIATKNDLIRWLKEIDNRLDSPLLLIAVGGTAMTLLNLKESTKDIDFCIKSEDFNRFKRLTENAKLKVDIFRDGFIFSEQLPDDYISISDEYKDVNFRKIILETLNPLDIIITKAARYNERDEGDIAALVKTKRINKEELVKRFKKIIGTYSGSEKDFKYHFSIILKKHFTSEPPSPSRP